MDASPPTHPRHAALVWLIAGATCCLLLACASKAPPPAALNRCPPERPGCQIEVVFTDVGLGERVARLDNRVSAEQPNVSYLFTAAAGERLRLKLSGSPVHLVLTRPNGQSDGPGLPAEMVLSPKGKYVLRVSADATEDKESGQFQLEIRLDRAP